MSSLARFRTALSRRVVRFLFPAQDDAWLGLLRIGLGLTIVFYCFQLRRDWQLLFSQSGLIRRQFAEILLATESPFVPTIGWLVAAARPFGLGEVATLSVVWWSLLVASAAMVLGIFSRPAAISAWLLHLCAAKSGGLLAYGVDNFLTIGLFYLAISPLPDRLSLDSRLSLFRKKDARLVGFFRRILQSHLCLIYFFSGLTKCLGSGWWNGINMWRALIRPPFATIPPEVILQWDFLLPFLGISVLAIEVGYAFAIWREKLRLPWLALACAMHLGIGAVMQMYLFAGVMIVLNVAAFGPGMKRLRAEPAARV